MRRRVRPGKEAAGTARSRGTNAFTLIELLLVIAIIAILAVIALVNFLEAQTRAKVSRVKAELHMIAGALEQYAVDNNDYPPNDNVYNVIPIGITTPIGYIQDSKLVDPFSINLMDPNYGLLARYYTYDRIISFEEFFSLDLTGALPPIEVIDVPGFNPGAVEKYGKWRILSNGPDQRYNDLKCLSFDPVVQCSDVSYDPTNGSTSRGNILRTQKETEGKVRQVTP